MSAPRSTAKGQRRTQLLDAAARLMAEHGYLAVRLDDIGAAAGVSGPAIYRHFPGKEALLTELLAGVSARLLAGANAVLDTAADPDASLAALIDFHLDFALTEPDLIRIQERDLGNLPAAAKRRVRRAQRQYVEIWVAVLRRRNTAMAESHARLMAHATFGLLNSTPHAMPSGPRGPVCPPGLAPRAVLAAMAAAALGANRCGTRDDGYGR